MKKLKKRLPVVGEDIYIPTSLHVYRGKDDFEGGLCKISKIIKSDFLPEDHYNYLMIIVEEEPQSEHNWNYLLEHQEEWKKRFGNERGHSDPDYREEFNPPPYTDWH